MGQITYLEKRNSVYYARIDVPKDLVQVLRTGTKKQSLRTKDINEAKRLVVSVIEGWRREFDDIRARRVLIDADREHAVWDCYNEVLARDDAERDNLPKTEEIEAARAEIYAKIERGEITSSDPLAIMDASLEYHTEQAAGKLSTSRRRAKLSDLRKHLAKGETALIAHEVDHFLQQNRLLVDRSTPEWISLARHLMRTEIDALERTLERDSGDYTGQPRDPLVKPPVSHRRGETEASPPGESIAEVLIKFRKENPRNISAGRMDEACRDIGIFLETIAPSLPVSRITKKSVRDWKALLINYPLRATEVSDFKGMSIYEIVKANAALKRQVLTDRTVNRYLSSLSAFCSYAVANGYMESNPCSGMALPKVRGNKVLPFNTAQLNLLFQSPLFTGAQNDTEWRRICQPGPVMIRDHRFWVPLIMLFSGARPGEIGQLAVSDVRLEHGHWIMHITTEGETHAEGKSVKTAGSMRVIPIHPELERIGFLKYHAARVESGDMQLFPGAKRNKRGQMMSDFSREFGKYLTRINLKEGRGLSLYSFRHGAADALRRAGHLDDEFGFILGHTKGSMTGRYGILPQGMLAKRVELIKSISYDGLEIGHLSCP